MPGSFTRKKINVTIRLGTGTFGESGYNQVTLSGLRAHLTVSKAGTPAMGLANIQVYGMTQSQMNQVSTLGLLLTELRRNTVLVSAGDNENGTGVVFEGTITNAFADYTAAPQVCLNIMAAAGAIEALRPVPPSSYPGTADVATIMSSLATLMSLRFENSGVNVKLSNPYFPGTARDQAVRCAKQANINSYIDDGILAIWPKGTARGSQVPLVSPETGLVGYPTFDSLGIVLKTLYNPSIRYGTAVKVQSSLTPACGTWNVFQLDHDLESETPGGAWFSTMRAARPGQAPVA